MRRVEELMDQLFLMIENEEYSRLRSELARLEAADVAWLLAECPAKQIALFRLLSKEQAAEVFAELAAEEQERLIENFNDAELSQILDGLYADDEADLIEEMPANVVKRILRHTEKEKRAVINQLLRYPKNSAGSIMTTEYIDLKANMTVQAAFERMRRLAWKSETIYTCYVTDASRRLQGVVTVRELLLAEPDNIVGELMNKNVIYFNTLEDQEQVARAFDKYDFLAFPVADGEGRLVGIITVDDAMDVIEEENTEDIEKMAAILPGDKPYLKTGAFEVFCKRIPWLLVLMISATVTGQIIARFEAALAAQAALIAYIPMLMDTGGNSGSQASVTVIRSLSLQELRFSDLFKVLWKELRVALLCGGALAIANFLKIMIVDVWLLGAAVTPAVAAVVCLTLLCSVLAAKLVGCAFPMLAKKIGLDPAVMASPFITTIVDAISLILYFAIAMAIL